jgi:hypothetical protein
VFFIQKQCRNPKIVTAWHFRCEKIYQQKQEVEERNWKEDVQTILAKQYCICRRMLKQSLSMCIRAWACSTAEKVEKRALMSKVVKRAVQMLTSRAWEGWGEQLRQGVRDKGIKVLTRWLNMTLTRSLEAWREHTAGKQWERVILRRAFAQMSNVRISSAVTRWCEHVEELRGLRAEEESKKRKVVQRLMNGALVSTFQRWSDHIIEEKQMKSKALILVQRLMNGSLVSTFEMWREHITEKKQMKMQTLKVVQRMLRRSLAVCLLAWADNASDEFRKRAILQRMAMQMTGSKQTTTLENTHTLKIQ